MFLCTIVYISMGATVESEKIEVLPRKLTFSAWGLFLSSHALPIFEYT